MHRALRLLGLLAIPLVVLACQRATPETPPVRTYHQMLNEHAALLPAIQLASLSVTPIVATEAGLPKDDVDAMTLDEAFARKLVKIEEQIDQSVNALTLTNLADRPLFVLAGEVIVGGKQDRIIGQNAIIAAKATLAVPVFCVEHGRWDNSSTVFASGEALAHGRLRAHASFANQQEVWREVAVKNGLREVRNETDTYRHVARQQHGGAIAGQERAIAAALAKADPIDRERMVGYVVALNGKVSTVDLFDSPRLFRKLETKLVRSYVTDAIDVPVERTARAPTTGEIQAFMADADKAVAETSYENDAGTTLRFRGEAAANKAEVELKMKVKQARKQKPLYKNYLAK